MSRPLAPGLFVLITALLLTSCAGFDETGQTESTAGSESHDRYPDVVGVDVVPTSNGAYRFDVMISSLYDSPERYADAWRVLGPDGVVYGIRELLHDHAAEQPFTRPLSGVKIPDGVDSVTIQGRDLLNGWGGETLEVPLPAGG